MQYLSDILMKKRFENVNKISEIIPGLRHPTLSLPLIRGGNIFLCCHPLLIEGRVGRGLRKS